MKRSFSRVRFAVCATALLAAAPARALERPLPEPPDGAPAPAPSHAFELAVSAGGAGGAGSPWAAAGGPTSQAPGLGAAVGLAAGYRFRPAYSVAVGVELLELERARSLGASLDFTAHVRWFRSLDPWVSVGSGYRTVLLTGAYAEHAWRATRFTVGVDVRPEPRFALGPFVSIELDVFPAHPDPLATFVCAGVAGRFDLGGRVEHAQE